MKTNFDGINRIDPIEIKSYKGGYNWELIFAVLLLIGFWAVVIIEAFNLV